MMALPAGRYRAMLTELTPEFVEPGGPADYFSREQVQLWGVDPALGKPHDPRTDYYRASSLLLGDVRQFFEFLVPLVPSAHLDEETVPGYRERLREGGRPTALAISVIDVKQPADWEGDPAVTEHGALPTTFWTATTRHSRRRANNDRCGCSRSSRTTKASRAETTLTRSSGRSNRSAE
jgi:hypothetical protein